jgi:soluble lytic murein transglycosylase
MNPDSKTIIQHIKTLSSPLAFFAPLRSLREELGVKRALAPAMASLLLLLCLVSCQAQQQRHSLIDFYEGLKKTQADAKTEAVAYFEKALDSPNIHIAAAASLELMSLRNSGTAIKPETISKIRKKAPAMLASKASGSWAMALDALGTGVQGDPGPDRGKVLALALNNESRSPDEAIQYLLLELRALRVDADNSAAGGNSENISLFNNAENAAIAGRIAVSRSRYREALVFFRMVMADSPGLFLQYPELLSDLGRSFQYTASATGREGMDLFLQWEKDYNEQKYSNDENLERLIRFRLLFYAARIARQRGGAGKAGDPESVELFERALPWALSLDSQTNGAVINGEQTDACIWYILNTSLAQDPGRTIRYLEKYIVHWRDDNYYLDVMDKLARELLVKRQWADIINIFAITKNRGGVIGAKFAWIVGRAIQEGLLSTREMELAVRALGAQQATYGEPQEGYPSDSFADACFRIAYNAAAPSSMFDGKALYYRSLSAAALVEPFLMVPTSPPPTAKPQAAPPKATAKATAKKTTATPPPAAQGESDAMEFLLGFFRNGAAKFAPRYIRMMESDLSPDELRSLAEALGNSAPNGGAPVGAKQYQESMRLVSLYTRRDSYQLDRRDLELLYPRPFNEQVTQYARETGIGSAKLYALIRTESAFNPDAISRSGAIGLTQLMPATAEETAARILRRGGPDYRKTDKDSATYGGGINGDEISGDTDPDATYGGAAANSAAGGGLIAREVGIDLLNPGANIHMGAAYLAYLEERLGDPLLAILAYNGGMNRVRRWRNSIPARFPSDLFLETVEYAETMDYGRAVMGAAAMYRALY